MNKFHLLAVDVNQAGPGELAIIVNGGSIPATARMTAQNIYTVSFTPTEAGLYSVELFFNDQPLKGLTFKKIYRCKYYISLALILLLCMRFY